MERVILTAIEVIQSLLAPAVAISANALLLLTMQNRYSLIIGRIRQLNAEKRRYALAMLEKGELPPPETVRLHSIRRQLDALLTRARLIRNTVVLIELSILLYVLTSGTIGLHLLFPSDFLVALPLILFVAAMGLVFAAILSSLSEVRKAYTVIAFEVRSEEYGEDRGGEDPQHR